MSIQNPMQEGENKMKTGKTLQQLAIELNRQAKTKKDFLIDTPALRIIPENERLNIDINFGEKDGLTKIERLNINDIAHRQIGTHLGIPAKYYDKMRSEYPELLATNINSWFERTPSRRMLRTLDGTARAFLSDRYRRIDNFEVAETVLPILSGMKGSIIKSCELTDSRMYLKVVNTMIEAEVKKGDVVQAGLLITNSEVGLGSVAVTPLVYRLVCSNGMIIADNSLRKYHVGRVNEADNNFGIYRDETIEADDRAFLMKIEDTVQAAMNEVIFKQVIDKMKEATEAKMESHKIPQVIELTAKEFNITQEESNGILGHLIEGGDLSLYGLSGAITRFAHDVDSYDRSTELEATGWKVLTMPSSTWKRMNEDGM